MNTANNISAKQVTGGANTPQNQTAGPLSGHASQGLFAFLDAFLQMMQGGNGALNLPQGLNGLAEKIAGLLKKDGISAEQMQNMSPQDLASQISKVLQQQNIQLPSALQNMPADSLATKLAGLIQQNGGSSGNNSPVIKPSLTSDLVSPQSINVQDTQTKEDIAKKISATLEQQRSGGANAFTPAQFRQLEADFKQLQSAPGTVDAATMGQLTTDLSSFLKNQGVDQASISGFMADLTQSVQQQKDQTAATAPDTAASATATAPSAIATAVQPQMQQTNINSNQDSNTDSSSSDPLNISQAQPHSRQWQNLSAKNFQQSDKPQIPDGKQAPALGTDKASIQLSNALTQQQTQAPLPQQSTDLTARISGMGINSALISGLAGSSDSSGFGFNGGFGSQDGNAQQSQDSTGTSTLLQPMTADMLQAQNFTNFLNSAPATSQSGQPSPTTQLVNIQLQNNINAGINTMTLQLEPAELGKMNVKLSFTKDGTVKAHMTVDKPETLALLQKDSSHLQRALQQTGLTTDENSLSFDLRQQSQQQNFNGYNGNGGGRHDTEFGSHMDSSIGSALQAQLAIQSSGYITPSGVNIMV